MLGNGDKGGGDANLLNMGMSGVSLGTSGSSAGLGKSMVAATQPSKLAVVVENKESSSKADAAVDAKKAADVKK